MTNVCTDCGVDFKYKSVLARHKERKRSCVVNKPDEVALKDKNFETGEFCSHCFKTFTSAKALSRHIATTCKLAPAKLEDVDEVKALKMQVAALTQHFASSRKNPNKESGAAATNFNVSGNNCTINNITQVVQVPIIPFTQGKEMLLTAEIVEDVLTSIPKFRQFCSMEDKIRTHHTYLPTALDALVAMIRRAHENPEQQNICLNAARRDQAYIFTSKGVWTLVPVKHAAASMLDCTAKQVLSMSMRTGVFADDSMRGASGSISLLYQGATDKDVATAQTHASIITSIANNKKPEGECVVKDDVKIPNCDQRFEVIGARHYPPTQQAMAASVRREGGDVGLAIRDLINKEFKSVRDITLNSCRTFAHNIAARTKQPMDSELLSDISGRAWKLHDDPDASEETQLKAKAIADLLITGNAFQLELIAAEDAADAAARSGAATPKKPLLVPPRPTPVARAAAKASPIDDFIVGLLLSGAADH